MGSTYDEIIITRFLYIQLQYDEVTPRLLQGKNNQKHFLIAPKPGCPKWGPAYWCGSFMQWVEPSYWSSPEAQWFFGIPEFVNWWNPSPRQMVVSLWFHSWLIHQTKIANMVSTALSATPIKSSLAFSPLTWAGILDLLVDAAFWWFNRQTSLGDFECGHDWWVGLGEIEGKCEIPPICLES